MSKLPEPKLVLHVDVDSPIKLLDFYKVKDVGFDRGKLELFYKIAFERALEFFARQGAKATFFVVGDELERSEAIRQAVRGAHGAGHEIENHTYSHPFGLARLPDEVIEREIVTCSDAIRNVTGVRPVGFRSPGYSMNTKIINLLEKLEFKYDSSGFWSVMNPLLRISQKVRFKNGVNSADFGGITMRLPHVPYWPHSDDWLIPGEIPRTIVELPLPRTRLGGLPFYNNFNLWAPSFYSALCRHVRRPSITYLFHIIEFMDMTDGLPDAVAVHANVKTPVMIKIQRSREILCSLTKRYDVISTRELIASLSSRSIPF